MDLCQEKERCCGCGVCVQKCPQRCISFVQDKEGFLYPSINRSKCVNCGLCVSVCPFHNPYKDCMPVKSYAAYNVDEETRRESSSGGVFSSLATMVLSEGGVVFGALFDEHWNVVHGYVETKEGLSKLRGSKYVQSLLGDSYMVAEQFAKEGRLVLFSGTPCQIAGLKKYLGKEYENLITVDCICHGVPSPKLWKWYLGLDKRHSSIVGISFRNKDNGWKRFNFAIDYCRDDHAVRTYHRENPYMMAFLDNKTLRPSCSSCQAKSGRSHSDVTLADFWNVDKVVEDIDDDKGMSLILVNTVKGMRLLEQMHDVVFYAVDFKQAIQFNKAWGESYCMHPDREWFFSSYNKHKKDFDDFVRRSRQQPVGLGKRLKRQLTSMLKRVKR